MNFLERTMRLMTHLNIGATLATAAWLICTGTQVVSGQWQIPRPPAAAPVTAPGPGQARPLAPRSAALHPAAQTDGTWRQLPGSHIVATPDGACECGESHADHPPGMHMHQHASAVPRT